MRSTNFLTSTCTHGTGLLLLGATPLLAQGSFDDCGKLPTGTYSRLWCSSVDGLTAVGDADVVAGPNSHAVLWTQAGGLVDLGDLPGGIDHSETQAISGDGRHIVGMSSSANGSEAFRWTAAGGMVGMGDLPGGTFGSHALDVSHDGEWVVGLARDAVGARPVRWDSGGAIEILGSLPNGTGEGQALAITPDGSVIVGSASGTGDWWPFRWTESGGMQQISGISGMLAGRAEGVSDDGQTVVGFAATSNIQHAFRWTAGGGIQSLGHLPGSMFAAIAKDCSGDGSVVVGSNMFFDGSSGQPYFKATYWSTGGGLRALEDVLTIDHGLDLQGFEPWVAGYISADARTITGYGLDNHARMRGFVAQLPDACGSPASFCTSSPNSSGNSAVMGWSGSVSVAANDLVLETEGAVPSQFGIFYYGSNEASIPFGEGTRCIGGQTFRLPVVQTDSAGACSYALDLTDPPQAAGQISAGDVWKFQFWFRDPFTSSGFDLTDGLSVRFCP